MREWACINGQLVQADEAKISVFDSGFMQGIGLFETMRTFGGQIFRMERHLDRLIQSAGALGWSVMPEFERLRENVEQVVAAMEQDELRVRLTVTTGTLRADAPETPQLTVVATALPGASYPQELYQQGVTVVLGEQRQQKHDPTVAHKTTSYFSRLASLRLAHAKGALESLWFTPEGLLAEGSISSVFVVSDDELLTPTLETPILPGITRAAVLELAVDLGIPTREVDLRIADLLEADEVFVTNSLMGVMPVARIERERVGQEKPGETTRQLTEAYVQLVERECPDA